MKKTAIIEKIEEYSLEDIMGERFGRYSKYIIQDRAIPDVRDGLKPVQRRILYSMYRAHNTYDKKKVKCANAVGDIMGKYHPHGDSSIYDALVRMSQPWKARIPYIDFQGNNGSIDGDGPAAYRYTESRLSKFSNELLKDIDKETVNMALNYSDTLFEPTVLPARFPNLLVGGAMGISAGYATNIPPHNLGEVIDATIKRIDSPNCSLDTIMEIIPGPDFPIGGVIEGKEGIKEAYKTGKGRIVIKSNYFVEKAKGKEQIVLTDLPYDVNRANLIKKINDIRIEKKIDGILDARDESDKEGYRIAIDLKKDSNSDLIVNYLLKNTDMQTSYNFNMIAIVNRRPKLLGLLDILDAYISHKREVVKNRINFDLRHAKDSSHILEGLIKAISILDEVIRVIRGSKNKADAIVNLVKEFQFTQKQADAIVTLQLYRLTNTDIESLQQELDKLHANIYEYEKLLSNDNELNKVMKEELREVKKEFALPRVTTISGEITEIKIDQTMMIPKEDVVVVITGEGYVKRVSKKSYVASSEEATMLKEEDYVIGLFEQNTLDTLLVFTNKGNYLYLPVYELPDLKWKELGKHVSNMVFLEPEEKVIKAIPISDFNDKREIIMFTKNGMVKKSNLLDFKIQRYSKSIMYMKLKDDDEVVNVAMDMNNEIFITTKNGYGLWYDRSEIPTIGLKTAGVKAINLKNDEVVSGNTFNGYDNYVIIITNKGLAKRIKLTEFEKTSRAKRGLLLIREVKSNPQSIIKSYVLNSKELMTIKTDSKTIIIKLTEIPIMDRYSTGSTICKGVVKDVYLSLELSKDDIKNSDEKPVDKEKTKVNKEVSLKEIDDKFMTIDDFLDNFN
ncbi:MAG: DNA topoisomerase IV subunit A [Bacilli bacterium]